MWLPSLLERRQAEARARVQVRKARKRLLKQLATDAWGSKRYKNKPNSGRPKKQRPIQVIYVAAAPAQVEIQ